MNLPSIPEYEQTDPSMRPNMTRLCIITSENLEKTQQSLGHGAFGTVFLVNLFSFSFTSPSYFIPNLN